MNGPDQLGPPGGIPQPSEAAPTPRRRTARRRRRVTLASVGAVVGIAVGVATIWHLLTEPTPPHQSPIVADLKTIRNQVTKLSRIRSTIEVDVKSALAGNITLANAARDISARNSHRQEVIQTLRVLTSGQKNVPSLAVQLSKIVVLEQKTATAYVACFHAGHAICPLAQVIRDQQGKLKTTFATNFDAFVAKHQWDIDDVSGSQL